MRITIVNQFYKPDLAPTATLAASLAEDRAKRGDEVTVIAGKGGYTGGETGKGASPGDDKARGPRVLRVWTPGLGKKKHLSRLIDYSAYYLFTFFRLLTMRGQDVIISLTTPPMIAWAATFHKVLHRKAKIVLWNMDCYPDLAEAMRVMAPGGFWASRCRARNRAIFRKLDHLVCLDPAMAELLCRQYAPVRESLPVTIIPNWEDLSYFPAAERYEPAPIYRELGLEGRFIVLYLGNMGYGHDFATALDAAEAMKDEPITFVYIGGGRREAEVAKEVDRRGLKNVVLRGYVDKAQTRGVMAGAACALVTLRDDMLGVMSPSKVHSNLALGLPLAYIGPVGSNVDEAIRAHNVGISLRHGDAAGLVAFFRRLMGDAKEHARLREASRRAFESAYCDAATMPLFDSVIRQTTQGTTGDARVPSATAAEYARRAAGYGGTA